MTLMTSILSSFKHFYVIDLINNCITESVVSETSYHEYYTVFEKQIRKVF